MPYYKCTTLWCGRVWQDLNNIPGVRPTWSHVCSLCGAAGEYYAPDTDITLHKGDTGDEAP